MNQTNGTTALYDNRPAQASEDVNATLTGYSEDEALDWAIENDAELDVATSVTDFDHMVGRVLSAARIDDDHVAIVVGLAVVAPDLHFLEGDDLVPVAYSDDDTILDDVPTELDRDSAELDDFFTNAARENENLAEAPSVDRSSECSDDDEFPPVDDDVDAHATTIDAPPARRVGRRAATAGALCIFALVGLLSSLGSGSHQSPSAANATPAAPVIAPVSSVPAERKAKPAKRPPRAAKRKSRPSKRRRAAARPSTPQAAPRPVVTAPQPARPSGGSCGSRSSEFSIEC